MRHFPLDISEQHFNLLWRSMYALEQKLLDTITENENDPDSELASFAGNDLVYLRLYRDELKDLAVKANFGKNAFSINEDVL